MTITRNAKRITLTPEELFQAYEEQQLIMMLRDVEEDLRRYPEFQELDMTQKTTAVRSVAKKAMYMTHVQSYNRDTAIILSIESYFKEEQSA